MLRYASVTQPSSKQPFLAKGYLVSKEDLKMFLAGHQKLARGRETWQAYQISFTVLFTCILLVFVYWRCVDPSGCETGSIYLPCQK